MVTLLVHHRVADYDAWRPVYDRVTSGPMGERVRSHQIWRGLDDPQLVVLVETYRRWIGSSITVPRRMWTNAPSSMNAVLRAVKASC